MLKFLKEKKKLLLIGVLVGAGLFLGFTQLGDQNEKKEYALFEVKTINLNQAIEATGSLKPTTDINLSFKKAAQVKDVLVEVGTRVKKGELLAQLENEKESAMLAQDQGILNEAQANLELKMANATKEDIDLVRADVRQAIANEEKAKVDLSNAKIDLENTQKSIIQDLATAQLDLENSKLNLEKIQITTSNSSTQSTSTVDNNITAYLSSVAQLLISAKSNLQTIDKVYGLETTEWIFKGKENLLVNDYAQYQKGKELFLKSSSLHKSLQQQFTKLNASSPLTSIQDLDSNIKIFTMNMNELSLASSSIVDRFNSNIDISINDISKLRSDISTAGGVFNSNISSYNLAKKALDDAITNNQSISGTTPVDLRSAQIQVEQKEQNFKKVSVNGDIQISNKKTAVDLAQAQLKVQQSLTERANVSLEKVLAAPRNVDIAPYLARVQQARARVMNAQSDFNDTLLKAPFDGIITSKLIEIGAQAVAGGSGGQATLSMIDDSRFHIDVNIPETQVNKVTSESKVTITFDAVANESFEGKILSIEPAASNVQGTIYYKAKIALIKTDQRLKTDMTANVVIQSEQIKTALMIPEKAISSDAGKKTIQTAQDTTAKNAQTIEVVTGLRGQNGLIEIISGLKAGDKILVPLS